MADRRSQEILAIMRGNRAELEPDRPALPSDRVAAEIRSRLRRQTGESVPPVARPEGDDKRFKERALELAIKHGVSRADSEAMVREEMRQEAARAQHRAAHEVMVRINRAEPERLAREAIERATKPRVQYGPDGRPVRGTSYDDLYQEPGRDMAAEKLRVQHLATYDELVKAGLIQADA
ncbi:hypothetical protein ABZ667_16135 [Streptomyces lavendulae]|uniref:hypothetical protein n=1 Tax=Streptomyces lavendulae TaxID=1914 RepID=UPI003402BE1E